jgi:hypothetical protein
MRPLFRLRLPISREHLLGTLRAELARPGGRIVGRVLRKHVELTVQPNAQHFWSPHLSVDLIEEGEDTLLRGRYAPHPHLWMFIMAVYGVLGLGGLCAGIFGFSQWTLGWNPWALWALPVCAVGVALTWIASAVGQHLAEPQMQELQQFFDQCMQRASDPPPPLAAVAISQPAEPAPL